MKAKLLLKLILIGALPILLGLLVTKVAREVIGRRYDESKAGYYHGYLRGTFSDGGATNEVYFFIFKGETEPKWEWIAPDNFKYQILQFESSGYESETGAEIPNKGSIQLPSMLYNSSRGTGILSRAVLSSWLLGHSNSSKSVDSVFGYIESAGNGTIPPPKHHGHHLSIPNQSSVSIHHFLLGFSIDTIFVAWSIAWLLIAAFWGRSLISRNKSRTHSEDAATESIQQASNSKQTKN